MPWSIRKAGKRYAIVKKSTGKVVGHSSTRAKAAAALRARYANEQPRTNAAKGYPKDVDMKVAKKVDLIVLPSNVPGTNCGNCEFVDETKDGLYCDNPQVEQPVTARLCCALWSNEKVHRPWGKQAKL